MPPYFSPDNYALLPPAPSGHTSTATHLFYQWLYANYLGAIPQERTNFLWSGPIYILGFLTILALLLFLYSRIAQTHRKGGELYGVMSFSGTILERMGVVGSFTYIFSALMILWALYFIVTQSLFGQVY